MTVEGRNAFIHLVQDQLTYKNKVDVRSYSFSVEELKAFHNELPFDKSVGFLTLAACGRDFELNYVEGQASAVAELVEYINTKRPDLIKNKKANWFLSLLERRHTPRRVD